MNKQIEALKMAIEFMEQVKTYVTNPTIPIKNGELYEDLTEALQACEEALEQEDELMAVIESLQKHITELKFAGAKIEHPAQEPAGWQSLSDDEIWDIANFLGKNKECDYPVIFAKTIDKALKEKNKC